MNESGSRWFEDYDHLASQYPYFARADPARMYPDISEVLGALPAEHRRIDPVGILEMVAGVQLYGERTLVEGVQRAPWMARPVEQGGWQYAALPEHGHQGGTPAEIAGALRRSLLNEAREFVAGRGTVGILLSGGMDSRIAAGLLRQLQIDSEFPGTIVGLTWGVSNCRDVVYARDLASRFGWEWVHLPLTAETLLDNIHEAGRMGAEVAPIHLHAIPRVAAMDGLDAVVAASYGDSVGRAEFSGMHVLRLRPILQRKLNRFGIVRRSLETAAREAVSRDVWGYRDRVQRAAEHEYREIEQQMHYMRRKLQAPMNLIAASRPLFQLFTSPEVFGSMWRLDPALRTDAIYGELIHMLPGDLHRIPWARTGRLFGESGPAPADRLAKKHHLYGKWLREDLREEITALVASAGLAELGVFNQRSVQGLLRQWSRSPERPINGIDERISWLAALAVFVKTYEIKPAAELFRSDIGDIVNSVGWATVATAYQTPAYRGLRNRIG